MKIAPSILLAIAAMLSASGCRAWNHGPSLAQSHAPAARASGRWMSTAFVAEHNKNAERIQTLEAKPTIGVLRPRDEGARRRAAGSGASA